MSRSKKQEPIEEEVQVLEERLKGLSEPDQTRLILDLFECVTYLPERRQLEGEYKEFVESYKKSVECGVPPLQFLGYLRDQLKERGYPEKAEKILKEFSLADRWIEDVL